MQKLREIQYLRVQSKKNFPSSLLTMLIYKELADKEPQIYTPDFALSISTIWLI